MYRRLSTFWSLFIPSLGLALLFVAMASIAGPPQATAGTGAEICGTIGGDTAWIRAESPYTVTCNTILDAGVRLDIEPGVEIRFVPGTGLRIRGTLAASGTPTRPITFTSSLAGPIPGNWAGLRFEAGSSDSALHWCTIEYATTGASIYATKDETVSPTLANCTVRQNAQAGIRVEGYARDCGGGTASPSIAGCTVERNVGPGIHYYGHGDTTGCVNVQVGIAGGLLLGSTLRQNEYGIHMQAATGVNARGRVDPLLDGNRISSNRSQGILMDGDDPVWATIQNNIIRDNGTAGVAWSAENPNSSARLVNNTITANGEEGLVCSGAYASSLQIENNILAANRRYGLSCSYIPCSQISHNDLWANTLSAYGGGPVCEDNLASDPSFVDAAAGDFHLELGSPCIDAGIDANAPGADIEGVARPQGDEVDIGAYEFWAAEITVQAGQQNIGEGTTFSFGSVPVGASRPASFVVGNLGNRTLIVEGIDLWPNTHYTTSVPGGLPLAVGAGVTATFELEFSPAATGEHTATVSLTSNDSDESPYRFVLSGVGVQALTGLSIYGPQAGLIHHTYVLTAAVQPISATQPVTYVWQVTGQSPVTSSGGLSQPVSFAWAVPGPQIVTVTAANIQNRLTTTHSITLYTPVESDFVASPASGPAPLRVHFTNTSRGDYITSWWDFGDGVTSSLENPAHTYSVPGTYTITLQVDGPGGSDAAVKQAYIMVGNYRMYLPLLMR